MASRRMFNIALINSDEFWGLSDKSKILYFYLALNADDDGFIIGLNQTMRSLGCDVSDFEKLIEIGYIISFKTGKSVIRHWKVHNYIRGDIYTPTQCAKEKSMLSLNGGKVYYLKDDKLDVERYRDAPVDESLTQDSPEKLKKNKDSISRKKYGEYGHVLLSDEEYSKLVEEYGKKEIDDMILQCDSYCEEHDITYPKCYLKLRQFLKRNNIKPKSERSSGGIDMDEYQKYVESIDLSTLAT